jgi:hypothetical protein
MQHCFNPWPTEKANEHRRNVGRIAAASPRLKARIAGVFYLLAMLTGVFASFIVHGRLSFVAEFIAGSFYIAATLLLYDIFKR